MPEAHAPDPGPRLIMAFDFGARRIGVASGDTLTRISRPLKTLNGVAGGPDWAGIQALLDQWRPALAVVGLPYNVDGTESAIAAAARRFAAELGRRFVTAVELIDERYSSIDAQARLKDARVAGTHKHRLTKSDIDSGAACVILERWFQQQP